MANTQEIDDFIKFVMEKREISYGNACAFALGYFTQYVPSEEIAKATRYMKEG